MMVPLLFLVQTSSNASSGALLSPRHTFRQKCLHVSQVGLLRFCLPANSSQKHTICRPQIITFFSYLFTAQVSSTLQRVCCVESRPAAAGRVKSSTVSKGGPANLHFSQELRKGLHRNRKFNRNNLRLPLTVTGAL